MKNCNEIRELLSFYLDNELHENDRKQVVLHLERCADCKAQLEELKNIVELISDVEEIPLPQDFNAKLHEKLVKVNNEFKPAKRKIKINYFGWSAAFVAVFAVALVGINMGFFDQITNRNAKVAYVNDGNLPTVSKDQLAKINESRTQIKGIDKDKVGTANKNIENKSGVSKPAFGNTGKTQPPMPSSVPSPNIQNNAKAASKTAPTTNQQIASVNYYTLSVPNTTDSTQIVNAIKNNGGQIQESYMMAMDSSSGQNYTINVSKDSYYAVVDSLSKIGTMENNFNSSRSTAAIAPPAASAPIPPRIMGANDAMLVQGAGAEKAVYGDAAMQSESQNVTIELKVQQK